MKVLLQPFEGHILALLRIVTGFLFLLHGAQKLFGLFGGMGGSGSAADLVSLMGLAGVIEFFGGLMVMLGIYTRYAAFLCSGLMAVAYFTAHFPKGFWPIQNGGELSALYSFLFLYLSAKGSGRWALTRD